MPGPLAALPDDPPLVAGVRAAMEAVVVGLVVLVPWAFGGVGPDAELGLAIGIAVLLLLWAVATMATGRIAAGGLIAACLAGITILGLLQLLPVSPAAERVLSPGGEELRRP